jgi:hypothetical protein
MIVKRVVKRAERRRGSVGAKRGNGERCPTLFLVTPSSTFPLKPRDTSLNRQVNKLH